MEGQPVKMDRLKEDGAQGAEERRELKRKHDEQEESPTKKLVDHHLCAQVRSGVHRRR